MPTNCLISGCPQPVLGCPDRTAEPIVYRGKEDRLWVSHPYAANPSGLCYFHEKKALGLFDSLPKSALLLKEKETLL